MSATMLIVRPEGGYRGTSDRLVDLRVDLSREPLPRLRNCYGAWIRGYLAPRLKALIRTAPQETRASSETPRGFAAFASTGRSARSRGPLTPIGTHGRRDAHVR